MRADRQGFTLVEVLVSLVVASLLLAIVMNGAATARERGARADAEREALLLARHLFESAASGAPIAAAEGWEGTLTWRIDEEELARDPRGRSSLVETTLRISAADGRLLFRGATRRLRLEAAQ